MVFFSEPKAGNMVVLKDVLRCFELAFGLKVNFHKSKVARIGISDLCFR